MKNSAIGLRHILPKHANSILVMIRLFLGGVVFLSIAYFVCKVKRDYKMCLGFYFLLKFQLCPSILPDNLDGYTIPALGMSILPLG